MNKSVLNWSYKYAVRSVLRNQDKLTRAKLADTLSRDKSGDFWKEVKRCSGGKRRLPRSVDGICGDGNMVGDQICLLPLSVIPLPRRQLLLMMGDGQSERLVYRGWFQSHNILLE